MKSNSFHILAVDDDRVVLDLYHEFLCPSGQAVESLPSSGDVLPVNSVQHPVSPSVDLALCEQAEEAVEAVRATTEEERPFALVFLDIHMPPGPDGVWAAEQIRRLDPNIGIVLVTGYLDTDLGEVERRVPPSDKLLYLQKPFHLKEIWQVALSLCTKRQVEKELRTIQAELEITVEKRTSELLEANRLLQTEIEKSGKTEKTLQSSEGKLRGIINNNADGIVILDKDGIVQFVNPAAEALFNRKKEEFIGETFGFPVVAGESTEIDVISSTGAPVVLEMRAAITEWEGETAFLASLRDITDHKQMQQQIQKSLEDLKNTMKGTVRAIAATLEKGDLYTAGHQQRVATLSDAIAREMGLSSEQAEGLSLAAGIHDIGKITIPVEILSKPGRLSELEFKMIRTHPETAYEILKPIEFSWPIARIVLQHHERMDGSGYPHGISGEEILMEARILAVADVVEAMASNWPYRPALGIDKALEEVLKNRDTLYDPEVVDACLKLFTEKGFEWS